MGRKTTVAQLAAKAGLDPDETLLFLWDAGLEGYNDPSDVIPVRHMNAAVRAVGLPTRREITSPEYWKDLLGFDDPQFSEALSKLGIKLSPGSRRLPKGAIAKLKRLVTPTPTSASPAPKRKAEEPKDEADPFVWRRVGREKDLRLLTAEEVESIHWEVVRDFAADSDPVDPPGTRSQDLLESAVFRQHTSLGGVVKYPTVEMAAAALLHSIVHDHPFHNGNKRTALVSMIALLDENSVILTCDEDELFRFVIRLAQHRVVPKGTNLSDREVLWIAEWIRDNSRNVEKGDRLIQWRRLLQILRHFGCAWEQPKVGNRINISRSVQETRRFGRPRTRTLSTQVKFTDEGREAIIDAVKKVRRDLWLDDEHGIDSSLFYGRGGPFPAEFIVRYRKTLKRLARL